MSSNASKVEVAEIEYDRMASILPLIAELNPDLPAETLERRLTEMLERGYRCVAARIPGGEIVGVAGFWTGCRFWCGRYIDADNVIVSEDYRNRGVGAALMDWIHAEGRRMGCAVAVLDSYVTFVDAHRFYERMGYEKVGYHFTMDL